MPPMMDSMTSAHTKTPMTLASWDRISEPMPAPMAAEQRGAHDPLPAIGRRVCQCRGRRGRRRRRRR